MCLFIVRGSEQRVQGAASGPQPLLGPLTGRRGDVVLQGGRGPGMHEGPGDPGALRDDPRQPSQPPAPTPGPGPRGVHRSVWPGHRRHRTGHALRRVGARQPIPETPGDPGSSPSHGVRQVAGGRSGPRVGGRGGREGDGAEPGPPQDPTPRMWGGAGTLPRRRVGRTRLDTAHLCGRRGGVGGHRSARTPEGSPGGPTSGALHPHLPPAP